MSSFHGRFALGQKTASLQEPGLLGDEREDIAFRWDAASDTYYNINSGRVVAKWVKNTSGGNLAPGSLVSYNVAANMDTDVVQSATGLTIAGVVDPFLQSPVANGESFLMIVKASRIPVLTAATLSKGERLVAHASSGMAIVGAGTALRAIAAGTGLVDCSCNFTAI